MLMRYKKEKTDQIGGLSTGAARAENPTNVAAQHVLASLLVGCPGHHRPIALGSQELSSFGASSTYCSLIS
jgi:hypothetical protein